MLGKGLVWALRLQEGLPEAQSERKQKEVAKRTRRLLGAYSQLPTQACTRLSQKEKKNVTLQKGSHLRATSTPQAHKPHLPGWCQPCLLSLNSCPVQAFSTLMPCGSVLEGFLGDRQGSLCDLRQQHRTVQQAQLPVLRAAAPLPHLIATQPALASTTKERLGASCSI